MTGFFHDGLLPMCRWSCQFAMNFLSFVPKKAKNCSQLSISVTQVQIIIHIYPKNLPHMYRENLFFVSIKFDMISFYRCIQVQKVPKEMILE